MTSEEQMEIAEYQQSLMDIQAVLATKSGYNFVKYLLKTLDVGEMPALGLKEEMMYDRLGFLRAGNSVFKLIAQASPDVAGAMLARIEREKYVEENPIQSNK